MRSLLRNTDWSHLRDYVSPSFFSVVPATAVSSRIASLSTNALKGRAFRSALDAREQLLPPGVVVGELDDATPHQERPIPAVGEAALRVFFAQIAADGPIVLDLSQSRWTASPDGSIAWKPGRLWAEWEPGFREAVRDLYRGFYGDDAARFDRALDVLGLEVARDTFVEHFGGGDQRAVTFDLAAFHDTFHRVFVQCREAGVTLDGDFLYLGIYLGCLYETLSLVERPFDVRAAYEWAFGDAA